MSDYTAPTPHEVRALLKRWNLTRSGAGDLADVNGRTVGRWTGGDREMSYTALYTLAHKAQGVCISPAGWREELSL